MGNQENARTTDDTAKKTILCFEYNVRDIHADYPNTWNSGWIRGVDIDDATEKVKKEYPGREPEDMKIEWTGQTWAEFQAEGDKYGWD